MKVRLKYSAFWPCVYIIILAELLSWHCWKPVLQRNSLHPIAIWAIYNRDIVNYWLNSDCSIIQLCMEWYRYMAVTKVMVSPPNQLMFVSGTSENVILLMSFSFTNQSLRWIEWWIERAYWAESVHGMKNIYNASADTACILLLMHDDRSNVDNWHSKCTAG